MVDNFVFSARLATAPNREKANKPDPQVWLVCNIKYFFAEYAQSEAETIQIVSQLTYPSVTLMMFALPSRLSYTSTTA